MNASTSPPLWHGNDTTDEMARGLRSLLKEEKEESTPSPPQFIRSAAQVMLHSSGASPPTLHLLPTASSLLSDPILTGETKAKDTTRKSTTATATPHLDESLLPTLNTTDVASPNRYSLATNPSKGQSTRDTPFSADLLEQAKAAMEAMNVPSSLMVGKLISTEYGIAMLVVPNSNVSTTQFSALTSPSTTTTLVDTKCKHWSKTEDELLKYAIDKEDSVPFNWKEISRTYFPRTRTSTQVRFTSFEGIVSHYFVPITKTLSFYFHSARIVGKS